MLADPGDGIRSPKTETMYLFESSSVCLELNPGPLDEQTVVLISEPSLQVIIYFVHYESSIKNPIM